LFFHLGKLFLSIQWTLVGLVDLRLFWRYAHRVKTLTCWRKFLSSSPFQFLNEVWFYRKYSLLIFKFVIDIRYNSCTSRSWGVAWFESAKMALLPWGESPHCWWWRECQWNGRGMVGQILQDQLHKCIASWKA